MSVFSPVTWSMGSVQLVSTTTSQLATLNSIQAAFVASTYWEVETSGLSSLSYKYIVVRPKAALGSIYADYRVFFCERVNFTTGRVIGDGTAVASRFNTTTSVMAYFCPDGGAKTFTPANIETGDIWPSTNYKNVAGTATIWHSVQVACTALWLYEGDGVFWLASRQSATSHSLMALGNVCYIAKSTLIDYGSSSPSTEIGCASFYTGTAISNASTIMSQIVQVTRCQAFWWKPTGVAIRTCQPMNSTNISSTGQPYATGVTSGTMTDTSNTISLTQIHFYPISNTTSGVIGFRGMFYAGSLKTRTTIQINSINAGYTFLADDSLAANCLGFINS